ncbi:MAG: glucose/arabinose dehydrogenase [Candidatus Poriferisodalaceae bacterium]|jgi:glucose/arabinose dehydrogenase
MRQHPAARLAVRASFAIGLFLLAACGGDDTSEAQTIDGDPSATSIQSADATPQATGATAPPIELPPSDTSSPDNPSLDSSSPDSSSPDSVELRLVQVGAVGQPVDVATRPGNPALFVANKAGRVEMLRQVDDGSYHPDPTPVLDISARITSDGERGLLGIAFSPDNRLFTSYTDGDGDTVVSSWTIVDTDTDDVPIAESEIVHLTQAQPFSNHNGGDIHVDADGLLYVALGDGGSANDPLGSGQDLSQLLGSIVRVRPTADGYEIPADNPFVGIDGARDELYVVGLRNPWRFSFDDATGDLWIGDVGQGRLEEIDHLPAGTVAGANLGWNTFEGDEAFSGGAALSPLAPNVISPIITYGRDEGVSVTGGVVYRGDVIPALRGTYLYADFGGGWIRSITVTEGVVTDRRQLFSGVGPVAAFGFDAEGEVLVLTLDGNIFLLAEK